jgi:hypothetical protein
MNWGARRPEKVDPVILERIRPVEVPVLTEVKRRLGREDVAGALRYAYPKVVEDLARAYQVTIPPGFSHEEIVARGFTEPMRPLLDFFEKLYRLYSPVRYGERPAPGAPQEVLELLQSLYGAEPMWRLYVTEAVRPPPRAESSPTAAAASPRSTEG